MGFCGGWFVGCIFIEVPLDFSRAGLCILSLVEVVLFVLCCCMFY